MATDRIDRDAGEQALTAAGMRERLLGVRVHRCAGADVEAITATEHAGARIAERMFARQERGESIYLIAWIDGVPVGQGEVVFEPLRELRSLHVVATHRRRGIGTAIILAAEEASREAGELSVGVGLDNSGARRLYGRLGYRATGEVSTTRYRYVDADGEHEVTETDERMTKRLP